MAENYVENFSFGEDEDEKTFQVKDPEAIEAEGGELANAIVTYDNEETTVQSFTDFISNFVSGTKIAKWFKDFKAGVEYILHVGSLVNNCVTDNAELPLSAAQGKVLMDELTSVKSDLSELYFEFTKTSTIDDFCETIWSTKSSAKGFFSCNYGVMSFLTNGDYAETNSSNFYGMFSRNGDTNIEYFMATPASAKFYIGRVSADKKLTRLSTLNATWVIT